MDLVQTFIWNVPYILFPLLAFLVLFFAPVGRRLLPALGLVLVLIDGVGDLLLGISLHAGLMWEFPMLDPTASAVARYVLNFIYAAGLLLLVLGVVRRVRTGPARVPDPAWSAPPPTAPGHPQHPGGHGAHAAPPNHAGHPGPGARPSGPNPGMGAPPASEGRPPGHGAVPGAPPAGGDSGPHPSAAPPPSSPGSGGPHQPPPGTPPQTNG
ncbi:hypothetical protein FZ103_22595 [Streptomonospora sp. PA3]|uniref:hypothetical protein n=1 Tax=Streptomonospora sp. PA3 TaxID=2607326 RepID=UPI0012DDD0F1|nr:hypothetical protein [Streptomonospora sp. PA3]MUL43916.1 hypothetical protein [Streptomonospora sp. PA3]